jgi:hypothetical protein
MHGKRVQFDDDTWHAIEAVADQTGSTFPELAAEAFVDLLKKHHQPVGFFAALEQSLGGRGRSRKKASKASEMRHRVSRT